MILLRLWIAAKQLRTKTDGFLKQLGKSAIKVCSKYISNVTPIHNNYVKYLYIFVQ